MCCHLSDNYPLLFAVNIRGIENIERSKHASRNNHNFFETRGRLFVARLAETADKSNLNHTLIHLVTLHKHLDNLTQTFDTKYVVVSINVPFRLKNYILVV